MFIQNNACEAVVRSAEVDIVELTQLFFKTTRRLIWHYLWNFVSVFI